ncbi:Reverse_transcriptase [Hexamita inflata]|nr:Reverse transcriptase [Hexamita inflata]
MNGLTKQIHNAQVSNIINIIDKKHNPMVCRTARQVNDDEQSKLQPDIVTKDNQTFDFSVSKNPLAMYKTKIEKYGKIFDNKNVIPIIITPWLQMDPRSIIEMSRYCKPDKLFKSLSFWTIYMESQKLEKYSSYSKENNLNHFDTEVQRTAQAAQSSAKKAQTNNDEIVIEIELEDTLNRISQNETVPGTSQSKGLVTF